MGKIRNITLLLVAVIMLMGCAASRKTEGSRSEERRDSTVAIVKGSVTKSETRTDRSTVTVTDENHTFGTMTDKGSNEENITERVTESTDAQGNKTTTTDRTIHRKGDYERNATYEARLKYQEEIMTRMQHTIDSLVLSNKFNVGTHWAKKDSTGVEKEKNTKNIKSASKGETIRKMIAVILIFVFLFCSYKYEVKKRGL